MIGNNPSQDRCFHSKPHKKRSDHLATKTILSAEEKVIKQIHLAIHPVCGTVELLVYSIQKPEQQ